MLRSRLIAAISGAFLLSACSTVSDIGSAVGDVGSVVGLGGGTTVQAASSGVTVADEPQAAHAGAAILAQGGSAADAATAMYFVLSVTDPVAAGLGGGGLCIAHDPATGASDEYDFLARDAAGGGAYAVPGNVRGFALLQASYGRLPWQRDVSDAESYAATGFAISASLANRLKNSADSIRLDAQLAHEFMDESGQIKTAGAQAASLELAQTLSAIRSAGANGFYRGAVAAKIAAYASQQGGALTADELAGYQAVQTDPRAVALGSVTVAVPVSAHGGGVFADALFKDIAAGKPVADAVKDSLARFGVATWPADLGATGFAARDASGAAVACAVTMNGPFGSAHTAADTGVTLARAPASGDAAISAAFLAPVVATDASGNATLVGAGAGGPAGSAAMAFAAQALAQGSPVSTKQGPAPSGSAAFDTVNGIVCQAGLCSLLAGSGPGGVGVAQEALQ
jgi:gamma-glutamyltranspeptidase/glutathione hydrolase